MKIATAKNSSSIGSALLSLFTSSTTLICCALPALLVGLGAGAVLAGLINAVPQLVLFSEYKVPVFAMAFLLLAINGLLQWRNRNVACPIDFTRQQIETCARTRILALRIYSVSVVLFVIGLWFAFVQPYFF
jgi:hypothetical protein